MKWSNQIDSITTHDASAEVGCNANDDVALARCSLGGTLDNDFNGGGKLIVPMGSSSSIGRMALDSQGRIVAAGWARPAGFTFGLVRLRIDPANGTLDGTFGDNGTLITDVYNNWGSGMTIQGDGDIVVVGSVSGGAFLTARYKGTGRQRLYYQQDATWNVTALVSADDASESYTGGVVVERYLTDPYGNVIVLGGNWDARISDESGLSYYGNPYGFQGGRLDSFSGKINFRNREDDPQIGWIQQDPKGYVDGSSLYQREGSNPIARVDPFGNKGILIDVGDKEGQNDKSDEFYMMGPNGRTTYNEAVDRVIRYVNALPDEKFDKGIKDGTISIGGVTIRSGKKADYIKLLEREKESAIIRLNEGGIAALSARTRAEAGKLDQPWDYILVAVHGVASRDAAIAPLGLVNVQGQQLPEATTTKQLWSDMAVSPRATEKLAVCFQGGTTWMEYPQWAWGRPTLHDCVVSFSAVYLYVDYKKAE